MSLNIERFLLCKPCKLTFWWLPMTELYLLFELCSCLASFIVWLILIFKLLKSAWFSRIGLCVNVRLKQSGLFLSRVLWSWYAYCIFSITWDFIGVWNVFLLPKLVSLGWKFNGEDYSYSCKKSSNSYLWGWIWLFKF